MSEKDEEVRKEFQELFIRVLMETMKPLEYEMRALREEAERNTKAKRSSPATSGDSYTSYRRTQA